MWTRLQFLEWKADQYMASSRYHWPNALQWRHLICVPKTLQRYKSTQGHLRDNGDKKWYTRFIPLLQQGPLPGKPVGAGREGTSTRLHCISRPDKPARRGVATHLLTASACTMDGPAGTQYGPGAAGLLHMEYRQRCLVFFWFYFFTKMNQKFIYLNCTAN